MTYHHTQRGSVLIFILLAVAMIAAIGAFLSRGSRTSESTLTEQQSKVAAQEIIAYSNTLANAVQKLRLRGCQENQFDFYNIIWQNAAGAYILPSNHNPTQAANNACSVFNGAGNIVAATTSLDALVKNFTPVGTKLGSAGIHITAVPGIGTSLEDLVYVVPYINNAVCKRINELVGVENLTNTTPRHTRTATGYAGTFPGTQALVDSDVKLTGKNIFCSIDETLVEADQRFYRVLLAR